MKRIIVTIMIAYILGIIIGLYKTISIILFFAILISGVIYFTPTVKVLFKRNKKKIIIFIICVILGVLSINTYNITWEKTSIDLEENNIIAKVVNLEKETAYKKTFKIKILNTKSKNKYILLKVNKTEKLCDKIKIGSKVIFNGEVQEIETSRNTGGFNYKEYLKSRKIYGIINWKNGKMIEESKRIDVSMEKIKNYLIQKTYKNMKKEAADFCLALSIGYKTGISEEIKENFNKSNLSHMLAISGMHISYLILFLNILLKPLKSKNKSVFIIILLIFFMQLTGNTPSVNRACLTVVLNLIAPFVYRKSDKITNLAISAGIILIQNPYAIKDLGFIFSYTGTIGIIVIYPILKSKAEIFIINKIVPKCLKLSTKYHLLVVILKEVLKFIKEAILITISANITLIPLIIYYFNSVSLLFIFSNLIITPILAISVILSFILLMINSLTVNVDIIICGIYSFFISKIIYIANFFSNFPFPNILICTPNKLTLLLTYFIIIIWTYFEKKYWLKTVVIEYMKKLVNVKKMIYVLFIIIFIFIFSKIKENELKIYFVDVGQGDCTLIITPNNKKILIDGGGNESDEYDIGKKVLEPYLLDRKIRTIDYLVVSHFDSDHVKGLFTIMENFNIKKILIGKQFETSENYKTFIEIKERKNIEVIILKRGDKLEIEKNVTINVIWPNKDNLLNKNNLNNNSLVIKLIYNDFSILFTGDIEEIAESQILQNISNNELKSNVIKIAHHGSKTSSTEKFLNEVKPKIALIGVGKNNLFGHPNEKVIERLEKRNVIIYRTDFNGEIIINVNKKGKIKAKTMLK